MLNSLKKKFAVLSLMVFSFLLMAVPAFASGTGTANEAVVQAFTTLKADVVATLGAVAGIAVAVMAIFLAWKYGRKIFSQIAR
jgi:hypothetical protein